MDDEPPEPEEPDPLDPDPVPPLDAVDPDPVSPLDPELPVVPAGDPELPVSPLPGVELPEEVPDEVPPPLEPELALYRPLLVAEPVLAAIPEQPSNSSTITAAQDIPNKRPRFKIRPIICPLPHSLHRNV